MFRKKVFRERHIAFMSKLLFVVAVLLLLAFVVSL